MRLHWAMGLAVAALVYVGTVLASLVIVAAIAINLPVDYFHAERVRPRSPRSMAGRVVSLLRNLLGAVLVLLGLLLSIPGVPGQGLLTVLIGVMVLDVPAKRPLERALVERPGVLRSLNLLRARFGKPALRV